MSYPHPVLPEVLQTLEMLERDPELLARASEILYRGGPWPKAVGLPIGAAMALLRERGYQPPQGQFSLLASIVAALTAWRLTKGAYLLDPDLWRELRETRLERIPVEVLLRQPELAPLILLPEPLEIGGFQIDAFHLYFDWDPGRPGIPPHLEARFLFWIREEGGYQGGSLVLDLDREDLEACVEATLRRTPILQEAGAEEGRMSEAERAYLSALLSAGLYLASEEPDIAGAPRPRPRAPRKWKHLGTPRQPLLLPTGWRWGAALRKARAAQERGEPGPPGGRTVAPHVRRAHWHLYWVGEGSRKDPSKAQARLRWVAATLVGARGLEPEDLPVVVRRVEPQKG
ncbi:hypothetical protein, partial [Thermus sp.]|uniref:hypothetical protein n=1 Tax=Thermus sp. TaxID=275 RepID=UPI0025E1E4B7